MAEFSSHVPGTFSWAELATTDQKAGVAFYRTLFGWDVIEQPIGPTDVYSMFTMRGKEVAAASTLSAEERTHGVPSHWNLYVTVASADDAVKRAEGLGAKVFAPPFDVMDVGRMGILQDPTGAIFYVWQARKHIGAKILGEPGAVCWSELTTRDTAVAESFYTRLFGWTTKHGKASDDGVYIELSNQGQPGGGIMAMPAQVPAGVPSFWMPYFMVAGCDASTAKAQELGANVIMRPEDIPKTGRFSVVADPQGAMFALFTPARA